MRSSYRKLVSFLDNLELFDVRKEFSPFQGIDLFVCPENFERLRCIILLPVQNHLHFTPVVVNDTGNKGRGTYMKPGRLDRTSILPSSAYCLIMFCTMHVQISKPVRKGNAEREEKLEEFLAAYEGF